MVDAIEKRVNINRHINGGSVPPVLKQVFRINISTLESKHAAVASGIQNKSLAFNRSINQYSFDPAVLLALRSVGIYKNKKLQQLFTCLQYYKQVVIQLLFQGWSFYHHRAAQSPGSKRNNVPHQQI